METQNTNKIWLSKQKIYIQMKFCFVCILFLRLKFEIVILYKHENIVLFQNETGY